MAPSISIKGIPDGGLDQKPLADALKATTGPIHKRLNRLIMCRMPLALPPRASDPSVYAMGLLHIAPIYMTFEALWQNILTPPGDPSDTSRQAASRKANDNGPRLGPVPLHNFNKPAVTLKLGLVLSKLFIPGLRRTAALRRDLETLTGWSTPELDAELRGVVAAGGALHDFITRIRKTLEQRPHVLVSYAYIFYMALFAGGRVIRSSLESQGASFWDKMPVSPAQPGMAAREHGSSDGDLTPRASIPRKTSDKAHSTTAPKGTRSSDSASPVDFLKFETPSDGEDLKEEFKGRLRDSESLLTEKQKVEIIQEASVIFEEMLSLVEQLDKLLEPDKPSDAVSVAGVSSDPAQEFNITGRVRDSVYVTKERQGRKGVQVDGGMPSEPLSILGEHEGEDGDAGGPARSIRFSEDLVHAPASVTASPGNVDST
ncbi:biliverdin-producing heme oxygenase [Candidatus Bathyarchaeota archaeon]|nr:biliverdin-producing heme oxygenase [Candidatus Bathyarchaeota archaeon]